ncbi:very short patch repair endonuclease [Streptomyces sp. NPDC048669]|uniref:very short patch repair endonuclease n=1 Tax=Streptomyces sp. NPDC048669 TaxID=3155267 RepID=UPI003419FA23
MSGGPYRRSRRRFCDEPVRLVAGKRTRGVPEKAVSDRSWRARPGLDRTQRAREQVRSAGGADRRLVDVGRGDLRPASIVLRRTDRGARVIAELRWSIDGQAISIPLGEVDRPTRAANLREGWRLAHDAGVLAETSIPAGSWASSPGSRKSMRANRGRDTKPELRLRSLLHRSGLRFRVSTRPLPSLRRTADVVFTKAKVAVFVDGCYWHGCPEHRSVPAKNRDFWLEKFERNKARDLETTRLLEQSGWKVLRIWEHVPAQAAARLVIETVAEARREANMAS